MMQITYDPEADALAIIFRHDVEWYDSTDLEEGVTVDLDAKGHIIGLEILDASERLGAESVAFVSYERLLPMPAEVSAVTSAGDRRTADR
ncbi:MAG: DUF2283 domain-containing protein [Dehalococcoidia bacterium]